MYFFISDNRFQFNAIMYQNSENNLNNYIECVENSFDESSTCNFQVYFWFEFLYGFNLFELT